MFCTRDLVLDINGGKLMEQEVHDYPARACAARGYVIGRGLYIYTDISTKKFQNFFNLSKY